MPWVLMGVKTLPSLAQKQASLASVKSLKVAELAEMIMASSSNAVFIIFDYK